MVRQHGLGRQQVNIDSLGQLGSLTSNDDCRTFRGGKVDNIAILLEHIDLLNSLNRLDVELLKRRLQLFVVHSCALVNLLGLSSGCALSTVHHLLAFHVPTALPTSNSSHRPMEASIRCMNPVFDV